MSWPRAISDFADTDAQIPGRGFMLCHANSASLAGVLADCGLGPVTMGATLGSILAPHRRQHHAGKQGYSRAIHGTVPQSIVSISAVPPLFKNVLVVLRQPLFDVWVIVEPPKVKTTLLLSL